MNPLIFFIILHMIFYTSAHEPACKTSCGPLDIKFPFGSGNGCGSHHFHPYISCSSDELHFTTHTGSYPVKSISYSDSTLTITPPCMSNCTAMQPTKITFGLDRASPFQPGPSTFVLLSCATSTYSNPICDASYFYLCASMYTCPGVVSLGLPLFPSTNSCCVYSNDNFEGLNLDELKCGGYTSVLSIGDLPADPVQWEYGVVLKYSYDIAPGCGACESSGGVCGYAPQSNSFVCVCAVGNSTTDCYTYKWIITSSSYRLIEKSWIGVVAGSILLFAVICRRGSFLV